MNRSAPPLPREEVGASFLVFAHFVYHVPQLPTLTALYLGILFYPFVSFFVFLGRQCLFVATLSHPPEGRGRGGGAGRCVAAPDDVFVSRSSAAHVTP